MNNHIKITECVNSSLYLNKLFSIFFFGLNLIFYSKFIFRFDLKAFFSSNRFVNKFLSYFY